MVLLVAWSRVLCVQSLVRDKHNYLKSRSPVSEIVLVIEAVGRMQAVKVLSWNKTETCPGTMGVRLQRMEADVWKYFSEPLRVVEGAEETIKRGRLTSQEIVLN